jgi:tryptophan synthase alpha chain
MSRIDRTFQELKRKARVALIPFVVAGDPDLDVTEALVLKMTECGADLIEIGLPFSDPLADGPAIQAASHRALQGGVNLGEVFRWAARVKGVSPPLILMTYFNPVFRYGLRRFAGECQKACIAGVIIPDLPPEEARPWLKEARAFRLDTIFLVAPNSPEDRIRRISSCSQGFIYYVSVLGVTGAREDLSDQLESRVRQVREQSEKPVVIGFGISTPEQVKGVSRFADGVVVGSAIVKIIEQNLKKPDLISRVGDFVSSLAKAL